MPRRVFNGSDMINTPDSKEPEIPMNNAPVEAEADTAVRRPRRSMRDAAAAPDASAGFRPAARAAVQEQPAQQPAPQQSAFVQRPAVQQPVQQPAQQQPVSQQPAFVQRPAVQQPVQQPAQQQPAFVQRAAAPQAPAYQPAPQPEEPNPYAGMFASWDLLPPMMVVRRVKRS